jgi:hypothetical protein
VRLKTVTLIAAIAQSLALAVQVYEFFQMILVEKLRWSSNRSLLIEQPIWIFAQITLVMFFFALYARQKQ